MSERERNLAIGCGSCEYEEADGSLVHYCAKCSSEIYQFLMQAALADRPEQCVPLEQIAEALTTIEVTCKARGYVGHEPMDCDWPHCDCDPHAERVMSALIEEGWAPVARPEPAQPPIWHRTVENDLEQERLHRERIAATQYVDIVFDGPPSHESGRFVEVEDASGKSIKFGEWMHRPDGYWALRIAAPQEPAQPVAQQNSEE